MELKIDKYGQIISRWLEDYLLSRKNSLFEYQLITDDKHHHYQILKTGWYNDSFRHHIIFHFHIKENCKVWLYVNNTDIEVGEELETLGIPSSDIVVGFLPTYLRENSKYAVA